MGKAKASRLGVLASLLITALVPLLAPGSVQAAKYDSFGEGFSVQSVHSAWNHTNLTYGFVNGTPDILGDGERQAVRDGMRLWSAQTPLTFSEVPAAEAEIKIEWGTIDGLGNTFGESNFPSWPLSGDVEFDEAENWTTSTRSSSAQPIDLVTVAAHEIGHSIGLEHSSSLNLMASNYTGSHRYLYVTDIDDVKDTYGSYEGRQYLLRNSNSAGIPNIVFGHGAGGQYPIAGDWNKDGVDTTGYYRYQSPLGGSFYLRNSNSAGSADITAVAFGNSGDLPVAGDWNNDGTDTIGLYRPSNATFYLKNGFTGSTSYSFTFGISGDIPIAGDWNNDGTDTVGLYRPSNGTFYLKNGHGGSPLAYTIPYGIAEDKPVAGDWNGDGVDTIGLFRPSTGTWILNDDLTASPPEAEFPFGSVGPRGPFAGDWDNNGVDTPGVVEDQ